jgi:hypothetical protein
MSLMLAIDWNDKCSCPFIARCRVSPQRAPLPPSSKQAHASPDSGSTQAELQGLIELFTLTGKISASDMICFDFADKIKRYGTAEEILEEFYPVRLASYQKCKVRSDNPRRWLYSINPRRIACRGTTKRVGQAQ